MEQSIAEFPKVIAYDQGRPVGVISTKCEGKGKYYIGCLAVKKEKQGKGIGTALMKAMEKLAGKTGYRRLVLECREGNPHAIEFYQKNGYRVCENYPPYENEADAVCLDKTL